MDDQNVHHFWGYSPALDLNDYINSKRVTSRIKILQVCPYDARHTITTLGRSIRHSLSSLPKSDSSSCVESVTSKSDDPFVDLFVYEDSPEGLARHLLLVSTWLDSNLPLETRAQVLLEIHGNAFVRPSTAAYIDAQGRVLEKLIAGLAARGGRLSLPPSDASTSDPSPPLTSSPSKDNTSSGVNYHELKPGSPSGDSSTRNTNDISNTAIISHKTVAANANSSTSASSDSNVCSGEFSSFKSSGDNNEAHADNADKVSVSISSKSTLQNQPITNNPTAAAVLASLNKASVQAKKVQAMTVSSSLSSTAAATTKKPDLSATMALLGIKPKPSHNSSSNVAVIPPSPSLINTRVASSIPLPSTSSAKASSTAVLKQGKCKVKGGEKTEAWMKHPLAQLLDCSLMRFQDLDALMEAFKGFRLSPAEAAQLAVEIQPSSPSDLESRSASHSAATPSSAPPPSAPLAAAAAAAAVHMEKCWDARTRKWYGDRYDYRRNMVDWDYHMRLAPLGLPSTFGSNSRSKEDPLALLTPIHFHHFRAWRMNGVAYELRDSNYNHTNTSLLSLARGRTKEFKDRHGRDVGRSVTARGFWGDITISPFHAFGTVCEEPSFFKTVNKQLTHTAVDIAEYNIMSLIREVRVGDPKPKPLEEGAVGEKEVEEEEVKEEEVEEEAEEKEGESGEEKEGVEKKRMKNKDRVEKRVKEQLAIEEAGEEDDGVHRSMAARGPTSLKNLLEANEPPAVALTSVSQSEEEKAAARTALLRIAEMKADASALSRLAQRFRIIPLTGDIKPQSTTPHLPPSSPLSSPLMSSAAAAIYGCRPGYLPVPFDLATLGQRHIHYLASMAALVTDAQGGMVDGGKGNGGKGNGNTSDDSRDKNNKNKENTNTDNKKNDNKNGAANAVEDTNYRDNSCQDINPLSDNTTGTNNTDDNDNKELTGWIKATTVMNPGSLIIVESAKYIVQFRPDQSDAFAEKVEQAAKIAGFRSKEGKKEGEGKGVEAEVGEFGNLWNSFLAFRAPL
eukprot:CAMPEP_0175046950 /NCGR_PEP_ID=MMETSP0052_2-20121109/5320_1 /TAXON_ID=51329 ORGANISM="Polytomella parva, Strain SAG 63-3" /NCGR_SAMPLE_ID=MMETSP0052_2 /ASSEMBLY_ACC=CAM_ASM_000194 /LENGTH=1015 /DNA_ID=CAMNT_0016310763 /DNA_START=40 /DNA_END=3087 /DNA_ORIENTATION=-